MIQVLYFESMFLDVNLPCIFFISNHFKYRREYNILIIMWYFLLVIVLLLLSYNSDNKSIEKAKQEESKFQGGEVTIALPS